MATNELQAVITADISGLESGLKKAQKLQTDYAKSISNTQKDIADNIAISKQYEKAIDQLNKELRDGTISQKDFQKQLQRIQRDEKETQVETANLRKELSRLKRDQKDLAATSTTAAKGMGGLGKSTANATPTVIEFSRVIQDAPYGIQGVANNIQQLTTNFGYLKQSAGGTLPALKALAGSFLGPAGIVFAVSTITSLLVSYGDKLFSSKSDTEKLADETEKAAKKMQSFVDSLSDVAKANLEGSKSAAEEIIKLTSLRRQIEDTTNSTDLRLDGIKRLRSEFGGYFKNISDEALLNGTAAKSYDVLTNSILKRAKSTAATNILVENAEKELDIAAKLDDLKTKAAAKELELSKKLSAEDLKKFKALQASEEGSNKLVAGTKESLELQKDINATLKEEAALREELSKIEASNLQLEATVKANEVIIPEIKPTVDEKAAQKELDRLKKIAEKRADVDLTIASELKPESGGTIEKYIDLKRDEFGKVVRDRFGKAIKTEVDVGLEGLEIPDLKIPKVDTTGYVESLLAAQAAAQTFQEVTAPVFSAVASEIGKTFQTNSEIVNAAINSIISAGAKMLQELIVQSIAASGIKTATATKDIAVNQAVSTSNAVTAASSTAAASGPAAAFLLPALIGAAIGFIAASFAGIKFAHGGIVPGGSFTGDKIPAMLNSGEMVLNAGQQKNLFDILNNNLSSLQNRSADNSNLVATTVLRGSDLYLTIEREKRKR